MDDLAITWDKIIDAEAKTVPTNLNPKNKPVKHKVLII